MGRKIIKGIEVWIDNIGGNSQRGKISAPSIKLEAEFETGSYSELEATDGCYCSVQAPVYYNGTLDEEEISITIDGSMSSNESHGRFIEEVTRCEYCGEETNWTSGPGCIVFFCPKCETEETIKV